MTTVPPTVTDVGVMSPIALSATSAYGTLSSVCRGVISASAFTATPRKSSDPVKRSTGSDVTSPRRAEK